MAVVRIRVCKNIKDDTFLTFVSGNFEHKNEVTNGEIPVFGDMAQLVRVSGCQPEDQGFDSLYHRHTNKQK